MRVPLPYGPTVFVPTDLTDPALWVGLVGLCLALMGSRLYRLAVLAPGVVLGAALGMEIATRNGFDTQVVAACSLGVLGGFAFYLLERLAIALSGAFVMGGLANLGAAAVTGSSPEWYVPTAGAVVGMFLFPSLYKKLLPFVSAVLGGLCVAWALRAPDDLRLVGGVAIAGLLVQLVLGRKQAGNRE